MPLDIKNLAGIMNLTDSNEALPRGHHTEAFNVLFQGNPGNMRVEAVKGNRKVNKTLPAGTNKCLGAFYDEIRKRVLYFNYNSTGKNGIYSFNTLTETIDDVLVCFTDSADDILKFDVNYPIDSVVILYRPTDEGDILYWTDKNQRPKCINIKHGIENLYGAVWKEDFLTVARPMPLIPAVCEYKDDNTVTINNLRKKLYQFRFRYVYKDNTKSTWSPYSKLFAPPDAETLATDTDQQKNNRIDAVISTGDADVIKIEVAARHNLDSAWSDEYLVETLDKADLSISDNTLYTYNFYNDGAYPYIDLVEGDLLFDYVPKKCNTLELLNGNVVIFGGITEGFNMDATLDIDNTISLIANTAVSDPFKINRVDAQTYPYGGHYYMYMTGTPQTGDSIAFTIAVSHQTNGTHGYSFTYTVGAGESLATVISNIKDAILALTGFNTTYGLNAVVIGGVPSGIDIYSVGSNSRVTYINPVITYATPPADTATDVNISCYKHKSKYAFGIVYFDESGVTNGVTPVITIETGEVDTTSQTQFTIPAIQFSINHAPPTGAKYFSWVRTNNLTVKRNTYIKSDNTDKETLYGYLDITTFQTNTNGYTAYDFAKGDRCRVIGKSGSAPDVHDYPVLDLLTDPKINGIDKTGTWVKLPYDSSVMSNWGTTGYELFVIDLYTPASVTDEDLRLYYEFGESYQIETDVNGNLVHGGQLQDQVIGTGAQPATFNFFRGDWYIRERETFWITDQSVSDKYPSKINGNGRAFVIDPYAKEKYYPTLVRFSEAYELDTNINKTNRFYPDNSDSYDLQFGDIQRFKIRERSLRVFQSKRCGVVPVFQQIIKDTSGNDVLAQSDKIINNIQYYLGEYGIGDQCLISSPSADYFPDCSKGVLVRLANDGLTPISQIYKAHNWTRDEITPYLKSHTHALGGNARIIGTYDHYWNQAIFCLQPATDLTGYTIAFDEDERAFSTFYSYLPTIILNAENRIISFNGCDLYVHDSSTYANFYGTQYYPSVTLVFNDKEIIKKKFEAIGYQANQIWVSDTTGDVNTSMINPQTNLQQQSQLKSVDYEVQENLRYAEFLGDSNSRSDATEGLNNGDYLDGNWISIKLTYKGSSFAWFFEPYVKYKVSGRNF